MLQYNKSFAIDSQPRAHTSREFQQDSLCIIDVNSLADWYGQCTKNTGNFPVLCLVRLPSPLHTLCSIRSALYHKS